MRRLKCEKETIILTNEDDGFYDVYTFNQNLPKRLRGFAAKYPDDCWLKGSSEDGSETYMIKKARLSLNLRPPYSKDRIHKATEYLKNPQNCLIYIKAMILERISAGLCSSLILSEKLYPHLLEIDRAEQERMDAMLPRMMEAAGVTEKLKAHDPMRWVGLMNTLKAQAEEIILDELIL